MRRLVHRKSVPGPVGFDHVAALNVGMVRHARPPVFREAVPLSHCAQSRTQVCSTSQTAALNKAMTKNDPRGPLKFLPRERGTRRYPHL